MSGEIKVVAQTDGLVILGLSKVLPKHPKKKYPFRHSTVKEVVYHHSAGNLKEFPAGLERMAKYFVRGRALGGRDWPGFGYHYYVPHDPPVAVCEDGSKKYVIAQTQSPFVRSYHTKGANDSGVGVVFQGSFHNGREPSDAQKVIACDLWKHLRDRFGLNRLGLTCHSMYGKRNCPGTWLENFVKGVRDAG